MGIFKYEKLANATWYLDSRIEIKHSGTMIRTTRVRNYFYLIHSNDWINIFVFDIKIGACFDLKFIFTNHRA